MGHGVSACATCDGAFFPDKEVTRRRWRGHGDGRGQLPHALRVQSDHRAPARRISGPRSIMLERAQKNPEDRLGAQQGQSSRDPARARTARSTDVACSKTRSSGERDGSADATASSSRSGTRRTRRCLSDQGREGRQRLHQACTNGNVHVRRGRLRLRRRDGPRVSPSCDRSRAPAAWRRSTPNAGSRQQEGSIGMTEGRIDGPARRRHGCRHGDRSSDRAAPRGATGREPLAPRSRTQIGWPQTAKQANGAQVARSSARATCATAAAVGAWRWPRPPRRCKDPCTALVANSGIGGPNEAGERATVSTTSSSTNLTGTYSTCIRAAEAAPCRRARMRGTWSPSRRSSLGSACPAYTGYCASKAGILGLVRALACRASAESAMCRSTRSARAGSTRPWHTKDWKGWRRAMGVSKDEAHRYRDASKFRSGG